MEPGTGGGSGRRRRLSDAGRDSLAGLTLGAVLGNDKRSTSQVSRTLLDIIRDEEPNNGAYKNLINHHNNKKSWKSFKDRLRLRRAGAAWTSSDDSPSSDNRMRSYRSSPQLTRRDSTCTPSQTQTISFESLEDVNQPQDSSVVCDPSTQTCSRPQFSRRNSVRGPSLTDQTQSATESGDSLVVETVPVSDVPIQNNNRMNMLRRNSSHLPSFSTNSSQQQSDPFDDYESAPGIRLSAALAAEREQIQRVVSSSEAAAAASAESEREGEEEEDGVHNTEEVAAPDTEAVAAAQQQPVRMSLMDLLEETDRQMGWVSYMAEDDDDEEAEEEVDERGGGGGGAGIEYNCCVCMVRHKGSAFIPCGHTFCRLCSRELWVSRGNCPLCNGYILEILDIF